MAMPAMTLAMMALHAAMFATLTALHAGRMHEDLQAALLIFR